MTADASAARTPGPSRRDTAPEVDDERQPSERQDQRGPHPPPDRLLEDEPGVERDQDRRDVLDQEGDPDLEPVDRHEIEELDEGQADDAEEEEERQLLAA